MSMTSIFGHYGMMKTRDDVKFPIGQYAQQYNLRNYSLIDKYAFFALLFKKVKSVKSLLFLSLTNLHLHFSTV